MKLMQIYGYIKRFVFRYILLFRFIKSNREVQKSIPKSELVSVYREALVYGVPLEKLQQKVSRLSSRILVTEQIENQDVEHKVVQIKRQLPLFVTLGAFSLPVVFIVVGLFLVGNAAVPLASYYINSNRLVADSELVSPLPPEQLLDVSPTIIQRTTGLASAFESHINQDGFRRPTFIETQLDYTNLANWFTDDQAFALTQQDGPVTEYSIDIPKLGITNAVVAVGGTDLDQSLIQYPGTAEPGSPGSPVIFGHSVLRQFYNPSEQNPRRYISIFSTIMTLQPGNEIFVTHNGVRYKYRMREKTEVKPEDVHILMQNYENRQLKLVTCTPEGTYLRRGVVTADLVTD